MARVNRGIGNLVLEACKAVFARRKRIGRDPPTSPTGPKPAFPPAPPQRTPTMPGNISFLDALRDEYETVQRSLHEVEDVEAFNVIDARMRKSFRWLEKAVTYLNDLKSPINWRFDLGYGLAFESPRFGRGVVGQHARNIRGFSALDEVNLYYEIAAEAPLSAHVSSVEAEILKARLEAANLRFTLRRVDEANAGTGRFAIAVPPAIPAAVLFNADYRTGVITVTLVNVDRLDRISLAFKSSSVRESVLEDVAKFVLGKDSALLKTAQLAGIRGKPHA